MPNKQAAGKMTRKIIREYGGLLKILGIILLITLILVLMQPILLKIIKSNDDLSMTYNFIRLQLHNTSVLWLFIISFVGGLFFITIPSDIFFLYYIIRGANPIWCIIAVFVGVSLSRTIDFFFGHIFREYTYKHIIKNDAKKFDEKFDKWGNSIVFFGNFIPLFPIEPFIVFVGTTDYKYTRFILYHSLGKILKLILIVLFVEFFMHQHIFLVNFFDVIKRAVMTV